MSFMMNLDSYRSDSSFVSRSPVELVPFPPAASVMALNHEYYCYYVIFLLICVYIYFLWC